MTFEELKGLAESQPFLYLTLPRKTIPKGDQVRLLGRSGPYGKLCMVKEAEDGYLVVAVFESTKVLDYIRRIY